MLCKKCGSELNSKDKFCTKCGVEVSVVQDFVSNSDNKKRKRRFFPLFIVAAIVLCTTIVVSLIISLNNGNDDALAISEHNSITGKFTDILVTDEDSAILAAQEAGILLELGNAADELTVSEISTVGDLSYYRLQQNYQGMPFWGRTMVVIAGENGEVQGFSSSAVNVPNDVDITVNLSEDDIANTVAKWSGENKNNIDIIEYEEIIFDNFGSSSTPEICYYVTAKITGEKETYCSVVISANNKNIVYNDVALNPAEICVSSTGIEFSGTKNTSGEYVLLDMENNFYCLDAAGNPTYSYTDSDWIPNSANAITSNTNMFEQEYDYVFRVVETVNEISSFYESNFSDSGTEHFALVINNGIGTTGGLMKTLISKELLSIDGIGSDIGVINLGCKEDTKKTEPTIADDIVTLAHEYTHVISNNNVHWVNGLDFENQAQAINEAYADLFSMIINEKLNSDGYIWDDGGRIDDIAKISETNYPQKVDSCKTEVDSGTNDGGNESYTVLWALDKNRNRIGVYSYTNAVVLEYAAYLMSAGSSSDGNLSIDELADLWYSTMLTLPSNCTYSVLRENMEMVAEIKGLSEEKLNNISSAFETIGVERNNKIASSFYLTVYDTSGVICTNYKIEISGTKYGDYFWTEDEDYYDTVVVNGEESKHIELPEGIYQLKVTATESNYSISREICVVKSVRRNTLMMVVEGTKTISRNEYIVSQLIGEWVHDANKTYAETGKSMFDLYGSSIKYGSTMIFETDGSFSYGIAAGNGGEGTFAVVDDKTISYSVTTYEEECVENGVLAIDDSGEQLYLIMNYGDDKVYWSKKTKENDKEDNSLTAYQNYISYLGGDTFYSLYDMDENGVQELIIRTGTCEADYKYLFYTYDEKIVYCGEAHAGHSGLAIPDEGLGLLLCYQQMGYSSRWLLTLENNTIITTVIFEGKEATESEKLNYLEENVCSSTDETSSPNENTESIFITDESSAEDLKKAIIGEWNDPNFLVNYYAFFENGSCKMLFSDAESGTFEITPDKTLKINMPWVTKKLKWDSNCLYSSVGWYFTSDGDLIIEGDVLKRQ